MEVAIKRVEVPLAYASYQRLSLSYNGVMHVYNTVIIQIGKKLSKSILFKHINYNNCINRKFIMLHKYFVKMFTIKIYQCILAALILLRRNNEFPNVISKNNTSARDF